MFQSCTTWLDVGSQYCTVQSLTLYSLQEFHCISPSFAMTTLSLATATLFLATPTIPLERAPFLFPYLSPNTVCSFGLFLGLGNDIYEHFIPGLPFSSSEWPPIQLLIKTLSWSGWCRCCGYGRTKTTTNGYCSSFRGAMIAFLMSISDCPSLRCLPCLRVPQDWEVVCAGGGLHWEFCL